jgi:hypothetical protein
MSGIARPAMSGLIGVPLVLVLVGCGSDLPDTLHADTADTSTSPISTLPISTLPISTSEAVSLEAVSGELILTRQRDLLDRGLVNVLTRNDSESSMLLSDIELIADRFVGESAGERTISLRSRRQVAIQVPYGVTTDCDGEGPVTADLAFTYTTDEHPEPTQARIELDGTDILETIRAKQCATRRFDDAIRARFDGTEVVDGTVVTRLVLEPAGRTTDLLVTAVSGTILVDARTSDDWNGMQLGGEPVGIPLTFVVNRCDPHALAEVTKRYGLALAVSVDGGEPVDVAIDVSELVVDLERIVEQCMMATTDG